MRHTLLCAIMTLVPTGLTTDTQPVSLSKFVPRIENLPESCQVAYNASIEGCTLNDFPRNPPANVNTCSAACVNGLIKIVEIVNQKCSTVKVPASSIIGHALSGDLIPTLCGNIVVVTEQPSSTQASLHTSSMSTEASTTQQAQSSSTQQEQPSSSQATDSALSASSAPAATSTVDAPSPPTQNAPTGTTQGLTFDTGTPPPPPSQEPIGQKSNPDSGGGSPFDIVLSDMSPSLPVRNGGVAMTVAFGVLAYFLLFL